MLIQTVSTVWLVAALSAPAEPQAAERLRLLHEVASRTEDLEDPGALLAALDFGSESGQSLSFALDGLSKKIVVLMVFDPFTGKPVDGYLANRPQLEELIAGAKAVVAMGGYNTFCEILSFDKRALIVPRTQPRMEQFIRAKRAEELGLSSMLTDDDVRDWKRMATALSTKPARAKLTKATTVLKVPAGMGDRSSGSTLKL